jgi:hypothetical protein
MAHRTNLAIQSLFTMLLVSKLENLLQTFYAYFSSSAKHHLQFTKFVAIVKIKGSEVIQNLKTRWISMFQPLKCVGKKLGIILLRWKLIVIY